MFVLECRISFRSRSPDDNSSLHSASAGSLDSALNHSREEEELKALSNDHHSSCLDDSHQTFREDIDRIFAQSKRLASFFLFTWCFSGYMTVSVFFLGNLENNVINPDITGQTAVVSINPTNPNGKTQRSSNESGTCGFALIPK